MIIPVRIHDNWIHFLGTTCARTFSDLMPTSQWTVRESAIIGRFLMKSIACIRWKISGVVATVQTSSYSKSDPGTELKK